MKNKLYLLSLWIPILWLAQPAAAVRPVDDLRLPMTVEGTVVEKMLGDAAAAAWAQTPQEQREAEVRQIQELLRLDELNRENSMREALRQENLEDRVKGHEDLELALEEKNVDFHLGKVLTDVHGNRVRMEEYVLRPEANQVQFVNLTMRDQRLDYINYLSTFNDILPRDTHGLWRKEFGSTAPDIYLVQETIEFSNLQDSVQYGVNYFEPAWVSETQQYVLPERDSALHVNAILKWGQERATPQEDFALMAGAVGVKAYTVQYPDKNLLAPRITWTFNDDTYLQMQRYLIAEDGSVYTLRWDSLQDLIALLMNFQSFVFNSYKEQIWTATEFEGRDIDTVSQLLRLVDVFADDDRGWR